MIDGVISLIKRAYARNADGGNVIEETKRDVLCSVYSASMSEFYSAAQAGLDTQIVFRTNPVNYEGEDTLEYNGVRYGVTRTYQASLDVLEIYAGLKVGEDKTEPTP